MKRVVTFMCKPLFPEDEAPIASGNESGWDKDQDRIIILK
jgi:hypothetical protein